MAFRRRSNGPGELPPGSRKARAVENAVEHSSTDDDESLGKPPSGLGWSVDECLVVFRCPALLHLRLVCSITSAAGLPFMFGKTHFTPREEPYVPALRHGTAAERGPRVSMEDCHVGVPAFALPPGLQAVDPQLQMPAIRAFYGVFDGHGGVTAAEFACQKLLNFTLADESFLSSPADALRASFLRIDEEFYEEVSAGRIAASGSTALAALVLGNQLLVANAGDSRAVLCRAGRAVTLSTDHKPCLPAERARIITAGGAVCGDGRLNGELTVARSIGDFHLEDLKLAANGILAGPLIAEPEVQEHLLTAEDEFLLLGCDGLWDVLSSQRAIDFARNRLREHNDPVACAAELVDHALRLDSSDNVSVIVVCFREERPAARTPRSAERRRPLGAGPMGRTLSREGLQVLNDALLPARGLPLIPEQSTAQVSGL